MGRYQHYGWPVSPYTAKTRAYFRYKEIPFDDIQPSAIRLFGTIRKAVGAAIMPTVLTPEGEWMQDSSAIIDAMERRFPERSIVPATPRQRVVALLLELLGDEWLIPLAIHYRWNVPENAAFGTSEFGRYGLPWLPAFASRRIAKPIADKMSSYRGVLGITPQTVSGFENMAETVFGALEAHLATMPFLFGTRPSIADFALYATPWAHVYRDPGTRHLFADRPNCVAWFERLKHPDGNVGEFLADDAVPETLTPLLRLFFDEQLPYLRTLIAAIDAYCVDNPDATRVPRALGYGPFEVGGCEGERKLITFTQWMAQRPLEARAALAPEDRASVDEMLAPYGGLDLEIANPFERVGFKMKLRVAHS